MDHLKLTFSMDMFMEHAVMWRQVIYEKTCNLGKGWFQYTTNAVRC